jgi:DNA-binding PadR family transcriptional regulator
MLALNFAILKYFTSIEEGSAETVMKALQSDYGNFRSFKETAVVESLMTAKANGILDETRFGIENDSLKVYYTLNDYGRDMVERYIKG